MIFDLDQTLIDSKKMKLYRDLRNWQKVYSLIDTIKYYPQIKEILKYLQSKNIKIAIVTSSPSSYYKKIKLF